MIAFTMLAKHATERYKMHNVANVQVKSQEVTQIFTPQCQGAIMGELN